MSFSDDNIGYVSINQRLFDRFCVPQTLIENPFNDPGNGSRFVAAWFSRHGTATSVEKVELAANGIETEGNRMNRIAEAVSFAAELRKVKCENWDTIITCCVHLYTRESFLYRLINQAMRDNDISKLETLGPFCWFIHNLPFCELFSVHCFQGRIYRGATLNESMINCYKQAIGTIKAWNGFSSASKDRSVAEAFGTNVLFIIDTNLDSRSDHSIDISAYSQFPEEQEVLIRAGRNFRIDKVDQLEISNKCVIYLTII